MKHEIERRFLLKEMPTLDDLESITCEKYIVQLGDLVEETVEKKNGTFFYEKKICLSHQECNTETSSISKEDFEKMKGQASSPLYYKKYLYEINPSITVIIFEGNLEGLVRADVTFSSHEEAEAFTVLPWMGKEVTHAPLGLDKNLMNLTKEECGNLIHQEIRSVAI
ncbi:MAG: hypothetical protein WC444_00060 [Candidatus Paceibacterota bacterium]